MGRKPKYTDEERRAIKAARHRDYKRRKSIERFGTPEEREAAELERRQKVVERNGAFEYVGNYNGSEGPCDIRCLVCGSVITRNWITLKKGTARCDRCKAIEQEQIKAEQERKRQEEQAERQRQREVIKREQQEARERAFWSSEHTQAEMKLCKCCGALFISTSDRQAYCSAECRTKVHDALHKDRRVRKMLNRPHDTITLERLSERDNGICYLCGKPVDWDDYEQTEQAFIAGNMYPSIEHVIPLRAGGAHSWENVKLAHRICNMTKH